MQYVQKKEISKTEQEHKECCCNCQYQVKVYKDFKDTKQWACTLFLLPGFAKSPRVMLNDSKHGLCECFTKKRIEQ